MRTGFKLASLLLLVLAGATAHAVSKYGKLPPYVNCTVEGNDFIGYRLSSAIRDNHALSPRYSEAQTLQALSINISITNDEEVTSSQAVTILSACDAQIDAVKRALIDKTENGGEEQ